MKISSSFRRRAGLLVVLGWIITGCAAGLGRAQTTTKAPSTDAENVEEFSRVRGLFDVNLPKTVGKYRIKYQFQPHFGDLIRRSYLRVPVGLRLGLNDHTEVNAEVESYLTHGLKKNGAGYGLYALHAGAKYQWLRWLKPTIDASTGFDTSFPLGRPPPELTDGHNHFTPYVTFSRPWPTNPRFAPFVSFGADLVWDSTVPGSFGKNQPHSHALGIAPGFLYERGNFNYALTVTYATTALIGRESAHYLSINPSVLWQLPPALTFHSKGRWIFGVGCRASFGPEGSDFGTSSKLRGEFSISRLLRGSVGAPVRSTAEP